MNQKNRYGKLNNVSLTVFYFLAALIKRINAY